MFQPLRVRHCLVCRHAAPTRSGAATYDLKEVSGLYQPPPGIVPGVDQYFELNVFVRFVGGAGHAEFVTTVTWLDSPGGAESLVDHGPYRLSFRAGELFRDTVFPLKFPFRGYGRYRVRLRSRNPRFRRDGRDRRWRPLASEYFLLVRHEPPAT